VCVGVIDLCIGRWERGEVTMVERVCLMLFGGLSVLCAGGVLLTSNPVHSVLFLVLSFMNAAGMMRLLEAEFRALLFIVVYVGAIAVLFLFVVMMLNLRMPTGVGLLKSWWGRGRCVMGVGRLELVVRYVHAYGEYVGGVSESLVGVSGVSSDVSSLSRDYVSWVERVDSIPNMETLGQVLYTEYALYVVLAGFVLLVAMIGAIILTLKDRAFAVAKRQQAHQQISRDSRRAIMRVKGAR
jgi:NADH-quinone oxidoreductase subunit J